MKKAMILTVAFLISIPLGMAAQSDPNPEGYNASSYVRLSFVSGDVFVQRTADLGYEKGEINYALIQGDSLATGNGQAEVQFGRRTYLRLDHNTRVEFALLPTSGDDRIKIHVLEGSAYLRVGAIAAEKAVEVHSPDASCYILEDGLYRFDVRPDQETDIFVREGSLEAAGEQGSSVVRSGESLVAAGGNLRGDPGSASDRSDDFDQWNASRDAQYTQPAATRYLPSDLEEYENELDQNGHWVDEQPYGNVWVPWQAQTDWEPYSFGHWTWYPEIGWNWISSESWGWPVYHYGRWHWRGGLGWYWIPSLHWGPAWVHWWWDNDYVGWCPLSWYNRPDVFEHNRFYDRYSGRDFPLHNRAMTVIRRDRLQDPGVERHRLRSDELGRIGRDRVSLDAHQPGIRPVINRGSLQTDQARRVFSGKSGVSDFRGNIRNSGQGQRTTPSSLRRGDQSASSREGDRTSPSRGGSGLTRKGAGENPSSGSASTGRLGRTYPSRSGNSSTGTENGLRGNRDNASGRPGAGSSSGKDASSRVYPSRSGNPAPARTQVQKGTTDTRSKGSEAAKPAEKQAEKPKEKIKGYPSSLSASAGAFRSRTSYGADGGRTSSSGSASLPRTYASRTNSSGRAGSSGSLREFPSRSSSGSAGRSYSSPSSSSRSGSSYSSPGGNSSLRSGSSSRSSSRSSYGRPSASGSRPSSRVSPSFSGSSSSRSSSARSYSAPSRSTRSSSAPSRSSRSYSAPSRSSPSYSSPSRSGRSSSSSSSGRSYSSSRSGSSGRSSGGSRGSSSRSSSSSSSGSSSGRSGSSKHKG